MRIFASLTPAWGRMRDMLFRPFSAGAWFILGFIFFLQSFVDGGGGGRLNQNFGGGGSGGRSGGPGAAGAPDVVEMLKSLREIVNKQAASLGILVATGVVVGLIALVGFSWIGTRGQMMAIRNVSRGEASVAQAWHETRDAAFSMFKVRLLLAAIGLGITIPLVVLAVSRTYSLIDAGVTDGETLLVGVLPIVVVLVATSLAFSVVESILRNFVAPLMWRFELGFRDAVARFRELADGNWGPIIGFLLLRFVAALLFGVVDSLVVTCTCCIGGLPVLHQTLLAPWYVFERAWTLYFIESAGPEWKMTDDIAPPQFPGPPAPPVYPYAPYGGYGPPGPRFPGQ